jgi:hypothetical protein
MLRVAFGQQKIGGEGSFLIAPQFHKRSDLCQRCPTFGSLIDGQNKRKRGSNVVKRKVMGKRSYQYSFNLYNVRNFVWVSSHDFKIIPKHASDCRQFRVPRPHSGWMSRWKQNCCSSTLSLPTTFSAMWLPSFPKIQYGVEGKQV